MRWFFLSILNRHQSSRFSAILQRSWFAGQCTSTIATGTESLRRVIKNVDLKIISRERIKPASPTPHHLRTFKFSIMDQISLDFYTPTVLFLPYNANNACLTDVITKRSKVLKESLSELLTQYHPFAGEIKDNLHIDCNDKGVYFVEARVNQTLKEFIQQSDDLKVRELLPKYPSTTISSLGTHILSVQVNFFSCGGIALSTSMSHKIVDGKSLFTFMNAWAAAARGSPEKISPSFVASELFPNNPSMKYSLPSKLKTMKLPKTKRFVFDSTALASLTAQPVSTIDTATSLPPHGITRAKAIGALIWKAAAKAASTVKPFSPQAPHCLFSLVNIRKRALPPLPNESIGNLIESAVAICFPGTQLDLPTLIGKMSESIARINSDYVESIKGENGHHTYNGLMKMVNDFMDDKEERDWLMLTSLLNSGIYEIDFGWGKPIWFYYVNPGAPRLVAFHDMRKGGGVEAFVSLSSEEMEIFERDPEILSYTTVDPSPLQFLD